MNRTLYVNNNMSFLFGQCSNLLAAVRRQRPKEMIVTLDFQHCRWIDPPNLAAIVALIHHLRQYTSVTIQWINCHTSDYLARIDFFSLLDVQYDETFVRHNEDGRFTPIKLLGIDSDAYSFCNRTIRVLENNGIMDETLRGLMNYTLIEVLGNVFDHAESPYGAIGYVQSIPGNNEVHICIVDSGMGIPTSLKRNPQYSELSDKQCLIQCLDEHVTDGTGQGVGLYHTRRFVEENQGRMHIFSTSPYVVNVTSRRVRAVAFTPWDGTLIHIVLNTENPVNPHRIFGQNEDMIPVSVNDYIFDGTLW